MERWMLKNVKHDIKRMAQELSCSEIIAKILVNRGITDKDRAYKFINASVEHLNNPRLMKDIEKGVLIIKNAIEKQLKILVVGDYDVDGVISTYMLYTILSRCGANVDYRIPDRVKEGYGINESIIKEAKKNSVDVIITCDNGIAAIEQVKLAKELGIIVIITDHHDIQFIEKDDGIREYVVPDADAVINPKQLDCQYPFKYLCGAGVVFKFAQILFDIMKLDNSELYKLLQFVAIATVCDVVDLIDENRIIVKNGLRLINNTNNLGLKALFEETGIYNKEITVYSLGFIIGPSINASGRLEQAIWALKLLLTNNLDEAKELAKKLHELNKERQDITNNGVEDAIHLIENSKMKNDKVLVVFMPEVHESVAGIIAGRIREKYNVPAIVLTKGKEGVKGSGRSIEEYNMFEELLKCKDLLTKFGGHPMAAGLSLEEDKISLLRDKLNKCCPLTDEDIIPKVIIDMQLPLSRITMQLAEELESLEPFGKGNTKPLFAEKKIKVYKAMVLGVNKNVLKLKLLSKDGKLIEAVYFGDIENFNETIVSKYGENEMQKMYEGIQNNIEMDFVYSININEYRGTRTVQLIITNYRVS
ncbi:single-stranded-DNA-specific exonuclease RecJ [Clostridium sp. SYSU_GA19001]|uniref:single-stranded-DNA-specific exonuclease RecJ n=1 Tax=Clostridium caldaquaticum TaxID=2940653 RepID=UPI00207782B0|nr:single-stranded-DNA-specific exonuclease RecJ [Clostridium caldaquaticum]MCM8711727.1 single-stranded-DNA-specific exonuclease RecJ [Clostridium caldaquaticum]